MSENKIKLSETVMLIDAAFYNFVVTDMKRYFEHVLKRSLQKIDLSQLITYIAMDAGVTEGKNEVQVLFVYDSQSAALAHSLPSDLREELNGVAYANTFGEFLFAGVPSEEMVTREELFLDLLNIVADSSEVKKMIVISFNEEYGEKVSGVLKDVKEKEIIQFRMNEPESPVEYRWEMLVFPLMHALGIKGDEI